MVTVLLVVLALAQQPARPPADIAADLERLAAEVRSFAITPPQPMVVTVPPTGNLQAALDAGGIVALEPGGTYGPVRMTTPHTDLRGQGATLLGTTGPGLDIQANDISVSGVTVGTGGTVAVLIGRNDASQNTVESVPRRITLTDVQVPTLRGKRGIEVNGADVRIVRATVADVYDPAGRDSQAVGILNTPGPVSIQGGTFSAGSEVIMVGGDTMKIPGVIPTDITITDAILWRPLSWRTDGVARYTKTGLELKTGHRVRVSGVVIDGCWRDRQDGYAVTITPRSGGAVTDVEFDRLTVLNASAGFNITGHDVPTAPPTPARTTDILVRDSVIRTDSATLGGRGILALVTMGPDVIEFERVTAILDGSQIVYVGDRERVGRLRFINGLATATKYGFMGPTGTNAAGWSGWTDALEVSGNTFSDAAFAFRVNLPTNTYVTRAELDVLAAAR